MRHRRASDARGDSCLVKMRPPSHHLSHTPLTPLSHRYTVHSLSHSCVCCHSRLSLALFSFRRVRFCPFRCPFLSPCVCCLHFLLPFVSPSYRYWFMLGNFAFFSTASLAASPHVVVSTINMIVLVATVQCSMHPAATVVCLFSLID